VLYERLQPSARRSMPLLPSPLFFNADPFLECVCVPPWHEDSNKLSFFFPLPGFYFREYEGNFFSPLFSCDCSPPRFSFPKRDEMKGFFSFDEEIPGRRNSFFGMYCSSFSFSHPRVRVRSRGLKEAPLSFPPLAGGLPLSLSPMRQICLHFPLSRLFFFFSPIVNLTFLLPRP